MNPSDEIDDTNYFKTMRRQQKPLEGIPPPLELVLARAEQVGQSPNEIEKLSENKDAALTRKGKPSR